MKIKKTKKIKAASVSVVPGDSPIAEDTRTKKFNYGMKSDSPGGFKGFTPQFQRQVLAVAARDPQVLRRYRVCVSPEYFTSPADQTVCAALLAVYDANRTLPSKATLLQEAIDRCGRDGTEEVKDRVASLYKVSTTDAAHVLGRLVAFAQFRSMANAVLRASDDLDKGRIDTMMPLIQRASQVGQDRVDVGVSYLKALRRRNLRRKKGKLTPKGRTTGFPHLDFLLEGGTRPGELFFALGVQKGGKSILLLNCALGAVSAGYGAVYVTFLDLSRDAVLDRFDKRIAGPKNARLASTDPDRFSEILSDRAVALVRAPLIVHKMKYGSTCNDVRNYVELLRAEGVAVDRLVLDHADHMLPNENSKVRFDNPVQRQGEVYLQLKDLAETLGVDVYTATQANRAGGDGKESLGRGDVSWSGDKLSHCDLAIGINQTPDERRDGVGRLGIIAGRRCESDAQVQIAFLHASYYMRSTGLVTSDLKTRIPTPYDRPTEDGTSHAASALAAETAKKVGMGRKPERADRKPKRRVA
jgi:replicative DNA helicase